MNIPALIQGLLAGDFRSLARTITVVENNISGYAALLERLPITEKPVTGITGAPGAGKSTLVDALVEQWLKEEKKIGVLCVDPASPFHGGALLGDRIRMNRWYNHPSVFIRSLSNRGNLGGLSAKAMEVVDVMKAFGFDEIIIETVGVGQGEVEIAALADTTVVVLVPEAGDEVQTMKAGLMEIADIFVVNKADRPGSDAFSANLRAMLVPDFQRKSIAIVKTEAVSGAGVDQLAAEIVLHRQLADSFSHKLPLITEKAYQLIAAKRMEDVDRRQLQAQLAEAVQKSGFNLYAFVHGYNA